MGVRADYLRRAEFNCVPLPCTEFTVSSARVSGGVEVGWFPGLALSLGGGVALVLVALAFYGYD